ncbi:MAG: methyltransferase domain-containing protein [Pseudomonadota bacterium]
MTNDRDAPGDQQDRVSVRPRATSSATPPVGPTTARVTQAYREGGASLVARRMRQTVLRRLHEGILERFYNTPEAQSTAGTQALSDLTVPSGNKLAGTFYDPTPRLVIRWILDALAAERTGLNLGQWNFIDIGTGRGRVVMEAAQHPFRRVVGVEFAQELAEAAEENVAAMPLERIAARRVGVVHADAAQWTPPPGPTIYFLYNPFDASVLQHFVRNALDAGEASRTPAIFAYLNPEHLSVFDREPSLKARRVPEPLAVRLATLSPYGLRLFETVRTNSN